MHTFLLCRIYYLFFNDVPRSTHLRQFYSLRLHSGMFTRVHEVDYSTTSWSVRRHWHATRSSNKPTRQ